MDALQNFSLPYQILQYSWANNCSLPMVSQEKLLPPASAEVRCCFCVSLTLVSKLARDRLALYVPLQATNLMSPQLDCFCLHLCWSPYPMFDGIRFADRHVVLTTIIVFTIQVDIHLCHFGLRTYSLSLQSTFVMCSRLVIMV